MSTENKMGVMPVGKLLIQMSLPMMISMLVQALYNIVDSVFVARISEDALTAVSIAFPIQNLMIAVATGTGVGINSLLSMRLGQKKQEDVNLSATNGLFLAICSYVVFLFIGFFCVEPYFMAQTSDESIIEYGVAYTKICLMASFGLFCGITMDRLLQSTGRTFYTMISQLVGAITNIILDPIMIFGLCGFPKLGIAGAALATVIGQFASLIVSTYFNFKKNVDIHFVFKGFRPNGKIIGLIYKVGVPSILLASIGSIMTYSMNLILASFTTTAVAVFGVYFKLQSFIFMPIFGMNNGVVPIIAFNYGAKKKERILKTMKFAAISFLCMMSVGVIIFESIPHVLLSLFDASEEMIKIGVPALRRIALHFPIAALCIMMISSFQALGNGVISMIISFIRQLVILLPSAYLFAKTGVLENVWWAFVLAEIGAFIISSIFMIRVYKKQLKNL